MPFIEVRDVTKTYGRIVALRDVSFTVKRGEYLCVLGPTGAGKTTLLKVIAGLLKPDKGRIIIDGVDVTDLPPEARNATYMPQGYALFPHMTVWENVAYGAYMRGLGDEVVADALRRVGLLHRKDSYPHELSGGQKQRVALARVLASGSKILLLDEPLSALDLLLNIELRYELRRLAKSLGLTVIHVTHNATEAMSVADRLLVLRKGEVQQIGRPEEVYMHPANLFVANFLGEVNIVDGVVKEAIDGYFIVEVGKLGPLMVKGSPPSRVVVVGFRPETVRIHKERPRGRPNVYWGWVKEVEFHGVRTRVRVLVGRGLEVAADLWFKVAPELSVGSEVYVELPPDEALVFSYPREGVLKAIALE